MDGIPTIPRWLAYSQQTHKYQAVNQHDQWRTKNMVERTAQKTWWSELFKEIPRNGMWTMPLHKNATNTTRPRTPPDVRTLKKSTELNAGLFFNP